MTVVDVADRERLRSVLADHSLAFAVKNLRPGVPTGA
jgi:hypothetical protein